MTTKIKMYCYKHKFNLLLPRTICICMCDPGLTGISKITAPEIYGHWQMLQTLKLTKALLTLSCNLCITKQLGMMTQKASGIEKPFWFYFLSQLKTTHTTSYQSLRFTKLSLCQYDLQNRPAVTSDNMYCETEDFIILYAHLLVLVNYMHYK